MAREGLSRRRLGRTKRVSSFDTTGGNADHSSVDAGENKILAEITGCGVIRHIWFTMTADDPLYLRKCVLRMYWDGQQHPSVESPVGDFFGVGHSKVASYSCAVMNMSAREGVDWRAAMNCYWPMPFESGARIVVENQGEIAVAKWYFYVDYDELPELSRDELRFHAWLNRSNPCPPPTQQYPQNPNGELLNLSDRDNYLLLEAEGSGHYCGANLSVHNLEGDWWGEGDDMVMIDGEKWPPDLHGTGTEDWFNQAWGSQPHNSYPYNGVSYHSGDDCCPNERITVYRYQIVDPITFSQSIRVSLEHGHANDRCDDYSSVAYWYQTLPNRPFTPLPPAQERLPRANV